VETSARQHRDLDDREQQDKHVPDDTPRDRATARWMSEMGPRYDPTTASGVRDDDGKSPASVTTETGFGALRHQPPVAQLSATPARWDRRPMPLGSYRPEW
jgi:hypothetical protein